MITLTKIPSANLKFPEFSRIKKFPEFFRFSRVVSTLPTTEVYKINSGLQTCGHVKYTMQKISSTQHVSTEEVMDRV